ncbi:MAG: PHP domain-containing protein [Acidilobaceae archaeon]
MMLKADVHVHSTESDGSIEPHEVILLAKKRGLDVVAITDHDTFKGSIAAQRYSRLSVDKILVLAGAEVSTEWGHILVLCEKAPQWILSRDPYELKERASKDNCVLIASHPFDVTQSSVRTKIFTERGFFDGVEVWNASSLPVFNLLTLILADKVKAAWLASSDAHVPEEVGAAFSLVDSDSANADSVLEAIRKGRTAPYPGLLGLRALSNRLAWSLYRRL